MSDSATELNRQASANPAPGFTDQPFSQVVAEDSEWIFAGMPRSPRDLVLDVAAGTGLGSRALAADVRQVIALEHSGAMLETGRRQAAAAGIENILFMRGDATALPFLDSSFRTVLCRFVLHHFADPRVQLAEIKRVLAPRGWLGIADLVSSEDPLVAAAHNEIERLRDRSHQRALSASELQDTLVRSGFEVAGAETREVRRPLEPWLAEAATPADAAGEIRARLRADVRGGEPTGLAPKIGADGSISLAHTLTSLLVLKPDV